MTQGFASFLSQQQSPFSQVLKLLVRHGSGDWGIVSKADAKENDLSVEQGYRILSAYMVNDRKIWVITEADRSSTTFLFPEEY